MTLFVIVNLLRQDFSIDDNAATISFPPGCVASANAAGLAKALSSKRRPHVTTVDLQVLYLTVVVRRCL